MPTSYRTDMAVASKASDAQLSAAFALRFNLGAYALLLDAGEPASSGIPTAWPLLMDLAGQVTALAGDFPEDPEAWYLAGFEEVVTCQGVLQQLGPPSFERQRLLRNFSDRSEGDVDRHSRGRVPRDQVQKRESPSWFPRMAASRAAGQWQIMPSK